MSDLGLAGTSRANARNTSPGRRSTPPGPPRSKTPATALDAACGTGRHAEYLATLGHAVIGVDSSPEMLAMAAAKVPGAEFSEDDLHQLPLPDQHVDVVVCALALTHVPELGPARYARYQRAYLGWGVFALMNR